MEGIKCENAKELSQRIHNTLKTKHKHYVLRPFNRFDVEKSMWWIVPSTIFPAYQFGKYFVDENNDGTFSVGIHIEKGVQQPFGNKKELMLSDDWVWHEFIKGVRQGVVDNILYKIYQSFKENIQINVIVDIPEAKEQMNLVLQDGHWKNQKTQESVQPMTISNWVENFPQIEWFWVDFYIMFSFKKVSGESVQDEVSDYEIVRDLLEPFEQWIK